MEALSPQTFGGVSMSRPRSRAPRSRGLQTTRLTTIDQAILLLRGERVMLDFDLAVLYEVTTGALNQAVKRNTARFLPTLPFG